MSAGIGLCDWPCNDTCRLGRRAYHLASPIRFFLRSPQPLQRAAPTRMATIEQFPQRQTGTAERPYRTPPHNIDAEQALLGAILINNDAFDRVSDFLRSEHFVEEIHRRIFEIAGSMIRAGKLATPITLKTFLGEHDIGGA